MQRCELAEECCVCDMPYCPYSDGDILVDGMYPNELGEVDEDDEGW